MSFSREVKEELSFHMSEARHCQIAEIAAIISMCGVILHKNGNVFFIKIHTENLTVAKKYFILIKKTFNICSEVLIRRNHNTKKNAGYLVVIRDKQDAAKVLKAVKLVEGKDGNTLLVSNLVTQNTCCKRAFIRGAFLAGGSISDPSKTYHFEIVTTSKQRAEQLKELINSFPVDAKIVMRKKYYVVYVKEGAQIVDLLNIMEAHVSLMKLENVRILKEVRNSVNRKVNCETANINKTVTAAVKQTEDILYIRDTVGFETLSEGLSDIARLRLEQPDISLKELGALLHPPIGKSGVNHRLRKLSIIAENLREQKEEM